MRVLPDRRPLLAVEDELVPEGEGPLASLSGPGAHEIIAVGRRCGLHPGELGPALVAGALRAARDRMVDLRRDRRLVAMSWSWDHGLEAGARHPHPHAQIIATPALPEALSAGGRRHAEHRALRGQCPACALIDAELAAERRVVWAGPRVLALAAWAPEQPFELLLLPRVHQPGFEGADDALIAALGHTLSRLLAALKIALEGCAISCHLTTLPGEPAFHWRLTARPRLEPPGGFGALTGWAAHGVWPAEAADWLRRLL